MKISEWKSFYTDEQIDYFIDQFLSSPILKESPFNSTETIEVYNKVINNKEINNRAKLFYLERFEDLIIKSSITTTEDIIEYKNSLL